MIIGEFELLVEGHGSLDDDERALLSSLDLEYSVKAAGTVVLNVTEVPLWKRTVEVSAPVGSEPLIWEEPGGMVRIGHDLFQAEIDPDRMRILVSRGPSPSRAMHVALKLALCVILPRIGGVCLHAAGLAFAQSGVAFFGVSGAGKSTLSGLSTVPVLSDEFVPLVPDGRGGIRMVRTPFWGTMKPVEEAPMSVNLDALVELHKGPSFLWTPIPAMDRLARLVRVLAVPRSTEAVRAALEPLRRIAETVPAFRMSWSPAEPPFERVREQLVRVQRHPGVPREVATRAKERS